MAGLSISRLHTTTLHTISLMSGF